MTPGVRKFVLTIHLTCSVGWMGAVVAYLALGIAAVTSPDAQTVRAAWTAMDVTGWWAIVPLAIAALLTGLVMSLATHWGLFRHYWVLISLALTILCTVVLVLHMPTSIAVCSELDTHGSVPDRPMPRSMKMPAIGSSIAALISAPFRQLQQRTRIHATIGTTMNAAIQAWKSMELPSSSPV